MMENRPHFGDEQITWSNRAYFPLVCEPVAIVMSVDTEGKTRVFPDGKQIGWSGYSLKQLNKEISILEKHLAALCAARDWLQAHPNPKAKKKR